MANPEKAFQYVLSHEDPTLSGVVTKEPRGGRARFGINSVAHPEAEREGFYTMPHAQALYWAETCFKYDYFNMVGGYVIRDQDVCNKYADLAFNQGERESTILIQRAVNSLRTTNLLTVDGKPGQLTLAAINATDPVALLDTMRTEARQFYTALAAADPKFASVLDGWIARVNS